MTARTIIVTGAFGHLGSAVADHFEALGDQVARIAGQHIFPNLNGAIEIAVDPVAHGGQVTQFAVVGAAGE